MHDIEKTRIDEDEMSAGQLRDACEHMTRELVDGVRHGFFEMTVKVETVQSKRKCITIKAGKSLRFVA